MPVFLEQVVDDDRSADNYWSVINEAMENSYNKALLESWKHDTNGITIFAGLLSVGLAFLVNNTKGTKDNPQMDQIHALLSQVSQQLGPSSSQGFPQLLDQFKSTRSERLHVNNLWTASLGFSFAATVSATFLHQWIIGAIKRLRMGQVPFRGLTRNQTHVMVKTIPIFIHISVLIFLFGLFHGLFPTNKINAIIIPVLMGLLYTVCLTVDVLVTSDLVWARDGGSNAAAHPSLTKHSPRIT